jgi:hypothetical protein
MDELCRDQKHDSLWDSIASPMARDHLTRRQKAARSLFLLIAFVLMALPCLIDLLLH